MLFTIEIVIRDVLNSELEEEQCRTLVDLYRRVVPEQRDRLAFLGISARNLSGVW